MDKEFLEDAVNLYFILAIGYNIVSLIIREINGKTLAPTEPRGAITTMTLLYLVFMSHSILGPVARTALLGLFTLMILRFGVIQHLLNYQPDDYLNRAAWASAIGINLFGVSVIGLSLLQ